MFNKFLALFVLLVFSFSAFWSNNVQANVSDRYFIVTAYYSPLPNQSKYIMGSYEAEVRMNGQGYRGASGKKVFSGMLAAPGIYNFGAKIYLEGLGVGEVADRGGAIVKAGERNFKHDRIDIWVGHGEEGLQRAMYWGKRTIKGKVLHSSTKNNIQVTKLAAPKWTTAYLPTNTAYKVKNKVYPFFNYGIGTKSKKESIVQLQTFLSEIGFYTGKLDGVYNNILMNKIYSFQKEHNIVSNWSDIQAGYWGNKTRELIWKKYSSGEFSKKKETPNIKITQKAVAQEKTVLVGARQNTVISQSIDTLDIFTKKISNSSGVKKLQNILSEMSLYNGKIDGEYSNIRDIILQFQLDNKLISNSSSQGAGNFGPLTRKNLKEQYDLFLEERKEAQIKKEEEKKNLEKKIREQNAKEKLARKQIKSLGNIRKGDISPKVRELQVILKQLGFFSYKDTAIFGEKTRQALINYQINKKLILNKNSQGAGIFGPNTKKSLIETLSKVSD